MEQIQDISLPQATVYTTPLRLSPYMRTALILLAGFALANVGVRTLAQSTLPALPPPDPFLEYADIFPGQPMHAVKARAFSCEAVYKTYKSIDQACTTTLASGVFANIDTLTSDGIIRQTTFTLRENIFNVGDLVLFFGESYFHSNLNRVYFFWNKLFIIVSTTANGHPDLLRPVWSVYFTAEY